MKYDFPLKQPLTPEARLFITEALLRSFDLIKLNISVSQISLDMKEAVSADRIAEVVDNLLYVSRSISRRLVYENYVDRPDGSDPMPALLSSREVIRTGDGMFSFQGVFWKVFKALQAYVAKVAEKHHAVEQEYPVLWPVDLYKKINYFKEFPQQVILSAPLEGDFQTRDQFADQYAKNQSYDSVSLSSGFAPATYGLQCAVCDTCYYNLRNTYHHPNSTYTTYNKVFRNERSTTGSLDRLLTFSVRDIMFVGDKDFVLLLRQRMLDEAAELLTLLNLSSRIETANDPFFSNDTLIKNVFQSTSELKYELLAHIPHSDSHLAVGSVNFHLDFFGQAFDIRSNDTTPVFSGCLGIGFERLAYALYCQYGANTLVWPDELRNFLGI